MRIVPGLTLVALLTGLSLLLANFIPLLDPPVCAVIFGIALSMFRAPADRWTPGVAIASKTLLQVAVVVLGGVLSLREVSHSGLESLPVMLSTLLVCLAACVLFARLLKVPRMVATLIGVGTAICGASAIAAASRVLRPSDEDAAYALSTIFAFNVMAVLVFPPIGHLLNLSQEGFGLWAGTAINDTSSVVAAATIFGAVATHQAVVVKLTRALMIVPVTIALSLWQRRTAPEQGMGGRLVPMFMIWFMVAVIANTVGLIPSTAHDALMLTATVLITAALAGIGLSTNIAAMARAGLRPFALGGLLSLTVAFTSLGVQAATGMLH